MEAPPASVSLRDEKWVCLGKQNGLKTEKKTPQICDERLGCGAAFLSQVCRLIYTNFTVNSSKVVPCLAAFACLQSKGWSSYCVKAVLSITISVNDCKQSLKREISGVFLCILQRGQICGLFQIELRSRSEELQIWRRRFQMAEQMVESWGPAQRRHPTSTACAPSLTATTSKAFHGLQICI